MNLSSAAMPDAVQTIYTDAGKRYRDEGLAPAEVEKQAWRDVQRAGWYETVDGWKQLGPNLTGKVNVRKLEKQPDGTFVVRGVPMLYPNAIKGSDPNSILDLKRIQKIAQNTNAEYATCGRATGVVLDHPTKGGEFKPAFGKAIRYRAVSGDPNTYECDIVGLQADIADAWAQAKIIGLSPGIVADAGNLNERIGHLALLGAHAPALSHLPNTEVRYAASETMVCFSTEPSQLQPLRSPTMNNYPQKRAATEKLMAAYAAAEAGEPESEKKIAEARKDWDEAHKEDKADADFAGHPMSGKNTGDAIKAIAAQRDDAHSDKDYAAKPRKKSTIYKNRDMKGKWHLTYDGDAEEALKDIPERKDESNAVLPNEKPTEDEQNYAAKIARLEEVTVMQSEAIARFASEAAHADFTKFVDGAIKEGHQFSAHEVNAQFNACQGNPAVVGAIKAVVLSTPKTTAPALTAALTRGLSDDPKDAVAGALNFSAEAAVAQCARLGINPDVARIMLGLTQK